MSAIGLSRERVFNEKLREQQKKEPDAAKWHRLIKESDHRIAKLEKRS